MNKNKLAFKLEPKKDIITLTLLIICSFLQALAIALFYEPNKILSMGISGISLLVDYTLGITPALTIIVLNIPIILVAIFVLDLKTTIFSVIGTFVFAGSLEVATVLVKPYVHLIKLDPLLAAIVGGAILGITYAPVAKRNATFGGMDIVSLMINKKLSISMGTFNIMYNILIMAAHGIIMPGGLELAVLSLIAMFVCNATFDFAMKGLNRTNTVFIISDHRDEIAQHIMKDVNRGLTYIQAEGGYTHTKKEILYCIVKTMELAHLKEIVMMYDKTAMFSVIETKEVEGRGFGSLN